jgi:hypothetical protein
MMLLFFTLAIVSFAADRLEIVSVDASRVATPLAVR